MDELITTLKKPMDRSNMGGEVAALDALITQMNNPELTGAEVPPGAATRTQDVLKSQSETLPPPPVAPRVMESAPKPVVHHHKFLFSGKLFVGKDYIAKKIGATIVGFSEPLYYLAEFFFKIRVTSELNKDLPGMRSFLQMVGQWGRGEVNEQYPYTPARAVFISAVRGLASNQFLSGFEVDWPTFGANADIWLDACMRRAERVQGLVAVTNARFENELKKMREVGNYQHWHVMCSLDTWKNRLAEKKLTPDSPQVRDCSERLAAGLDADVIRKISKQPSGSMLRVIWNDSSRPPSPRIWTLEQFVKQFSSVNETVVNTGE